MADAKIKVTKIDAARRQLRTAIELWFTDSDPVAIHTLAAAAHEIIHTLFKRSGFHGLIFDSDIIKDEYRGQFAKRMKANAAFFKHAREDPDAELEFNPEINAFFLLFAVYGLGRMEPLDEMERIFLTWFGIQKPEILVEDIYAKLLPVDQLQDFRRMKKGEFFEIFKLARRLRKEGGGQ